MPSLTPKQAGLGLVLLLNLLVGGFLAYQIVRYQAYPFDSDEALHARRALQFTYDLQRGEWSDFVQHSYQESVYPPAAAWFEAVFFVLFGASTLTARLFSLFCLIVATWVIYALALETDLTHRPLAGVIAVGLVLTAQAVQVNAALAMLEMPGFLVSLLTLWLYLQAQKGYRGGWAFLTSLLLTLTILTKYPFGIVIVATIVLAELVKLITQYKQHTLRARLRYWAILFGPCLFLMGLWFSGEGKVDSFIYYANLQPKQVDWYSWENLIFYPRSFAFHFAPALFFLPVIISGLIWAITRWREPIWQLVLLYSAIGLLLMTAEENNSPRFIVTIAPIIFLTTGGFIAWGWAQRPQYGHQTVWRVAAAAVLLCTLASLPMLVERFLVLPALLEVEYETSPSAAALADWIITETNEERLYFINPWDQFSTFAMEWYAGTVYTNYQDKPFGDLFVPDTRLQGFAPERADELTFQIRFYSTRYVVVFAGGLEGWPVWPEYHQAFNDWLTPVATQEFNWVYYDLTHWLRDHQITRASLAQAKAEHEKQMVIQATILAVAPTP